MDQISDDGVGKRIERGASSESQQISLPGGGMDPGMAALRAFQTRDTGSKHDSQQTGKKKKDKGDLANIRRSRLERTLFSVLHSMVTGNELPSSLAFPLLIFEDMQLLYFSWSLPGMPSWIGYVFNPLAYRPDGYGAFLGIFTIAWLLLLTLIGTIVFCGVSFDQGKFKYIAPLHILRAGTLLAVGALNVPVIEVFLNVLDCPDGHLHLYPEVTCYSTVTHLVPFVLGVLGLAIFVPYTLLMSMVYVDGNPRSKKNPMTKTNGRTDFLYLLIKFVILVVWEFVADHTTKQWILVPCLMLLTKEILVKQPFHNESFQFIRSGMWTTATLAAIITLVVDVSGADSFVPLILQCVFLLPGILLGAALSKLTCQRLSRRVYARFRLLVEKANMELEGGMISFAALPMSSNPRDTANGLDSLFNNALGQSSRYISPQDRNLYTIVQSIDKLTTTRIVENPPVFESPHEVELACRFVRYSGDARALILTRELFEAGFVQFPKDGQVLASAAFYMLAFGSHNTTLHGQMDETNEEIAAEILEDIAKRSVPFDIRFLAFLCEKEMEQAAKSKEVNSSSLNVSSYVEILSQERFAKASHLQTLNELKAFWTRVRRGVTSARDFETFPSYLRDIAKATKRAEDNYRKLLERFPKSKMILRLYAQFQATVISNPDESKRLLQLADEIEANEGTVYASDEDMDGDSNSNEGEEPEGESPQTLVPGPVPQRKSSIAWAPDGSDQSAKDEVAAFPVTLPDGSPTRRRSSVIPELSAELAKKRKNSNPKARKAASSRGTNESSENSRKDRRAKLMRSEFTRRLQAVPETYRRRLQLLSVLFVAIIVFSLVYSDLTFATLSRSAADFLLSTEIGRYAIMMIQAARLMSHFANTGATAKSEYWHGYLTTMDEKLFYAQKTYLVPRSDHKTGVSRVWVYDHIGVNETGRVVPNAVYLNQFELAKSVQTSAEALMKRDISDFQRVAPETDINLRYLFDNMETIGNSLKSVAQEGEETYIQTVSGQMIILLIALCLSVAVSLALGFLVLYPLVQRSRDIQVRYLKCTKDVHKKAVDDILVALDEQLELLSEDNEKNAGVVKDDKKSVSEYKAVLSYTVSLLFVALCAISILVPILARLPINTKYIQMVNFTNQRKYWTEAIKAYSYEVLIGDSVTWSAGRSEALLEDAIEQYEIIHNNALRGWGVKDIDSTTTIDLIYWLTEDLGCMIASCDPADRNFNSTIGFTYNQTISPLDNMILDYLRNARQFLRINGLRGTKNFDDDRLRFLQEMSVDIQGGLYLIDTLVLESFLPQGNATGATASVVVFVVCLVSFLGLYQFHFRRMVDDRGEDMETLVNLIHMIPPEAVHAQPKLQRLIESGGASLGDEETAA